MKKIIFLLSLLLSFVGIQAQENTQAPVFEIENSLLWEISGKDLKVPSYLYGTIHMIPESDFFITDATQKALDQSELVIFEIDIDEMTSISAQFGVLMNAFMPDGITIQSLLTAEEYLLVSDHFEELNLPMFMLQRIKPLFLSVLASEDMQPGSLQGGGVVSYELEFADIAKKQKKKMGGLETVEFQMSMFDSIPYKVQAQMLVDAIQAEELDEANELDLMIELYKNQDLNAMQAFFQDPESPYAEYEEVLLVNRNKNWIPIMASLMPEKTTFFAVGAGHLGGENGVIALLRQEGYTLRPLLDPKP